MGGTICTAISHNQMAPDQTAQRQLIVQFRENAPTLAEQTVLVDGPSFGILSEDMTIEHYNTMAKAWLSLLPMLHQYTGVIVAHGTDTLAYTAALMAVLLRGIDLPVILVSSHSPICHSDGSVNFHANGVTNFTAAVELIYGGLAGGVYATYQNPADKITYCHKGEHLLQCALYDDNFYSRDMTPVDKAVQAFAPRSTVSLEQLPIWRLQHTPLTDCVLFVRPYVGQNYDRLGLSGVKAVLHSAYHSGTCCVGDPLHKTPYSIFTLLDRCARQNIPLYFAPCHTEEEHTVYATVPPLRQYTAKGQQIRLCYGHTDETMWAILTYAYSVGLSQEEWQDWL